MSFSLLYSLNIFIETPNPIEVVLYGKYISLAWMEVNSFMWHTQTILFVVYYVSETENTAN